MLLIKGDYINLNKVDVVEFTEYDDCELHTIIFYFGLNSRSYQDINKQDIAKIKWQIKEFWSK